MVGTRLGHFWSESYGQIYPALRSLVRSGLASVAERSGSGRPPRRRYRITARGRTELARWLETPPRDSSPRDELALRVWLLDRVDPDILRGHLRDQRDRQVAALERWRAAMAETAGPDATPGEIATLRLAIALAEARIAWADRTIRELDPATRREVRGEGG